MWQDWLARGGKGGDDEVSLDIFLKVEVLIIVEARRIEKV